MVSVVISGEPKGKARPRMNTQSGRAYTPQDTINYENWVKVCYQEQCQNIYFGDKELKAKITCYYTIPKSVSNKKHKGMVEGIIRPTKKPDADNIAKIILDSLNKIAYKDDSQIVELEVKKYYSEVARVELILSEVQEDKYV